MYVVIELQTLENGAVANQVWAFDNRPAAEAKYHAVLSVAATTQIPCHACVLLDNHGWQLAKQAYDHPEA